MAVSSPAAIPESPKLGAVLLQLFEKLTRRARNKNPSRHSALAVLDPLHDPRRLATLRAVRALGSVHYLFTICCLCNLGHHLSPGKILPQATGLDE